MSTFGSKMLIGMPAAPMTPVTTPFVSASALHQTQNQTDRLTDIPKCPTWLVQMEWNENTTLDDVNAKMMSRNIPGIIFVVVQMLLGLVGNGVVILAYWLKFKRSNYRVYVLFLAFLDLMNCVFTMPFVIVYLVYPKNFPSDFICKAGHFIGFFGGCASPFVLVLIAMDRFRRICRPFKKQLTEKQTRITCVVILVITASVTWFTPLFYGNERVHTGINNIYEVRCFRSKNPLFYSLSQWYYIILTSLFLIVTVILFLLYYHIMKTVHRRSRYFSSKQRSPIGGVSKSIQTKKTTVTFMIITIVYVLSTLVHDSLAMILHMKEDLECIMNFEEGAVYYTFFWTVFLNNVSNPIIYGISDDRFCSLVKNWMKGLGSAGAVPFDGTKQSSTASKLSLNAKSSVEAVRTLSAHTCTKQEKR
ncbi:hypothetical protein FSP39_011251 [Pinctada imbricata]|uniref:G-protein coupled receptors family 1 profile domain-containing protein n=1 Tax=Pinctada imbricata TaxID=66713 RepID=A0AA88XNA1_PINIB|nr:hypothetical protein FSP39_011251 [Pinctada imbricata]